MHPAMSARVIFICIAAAVTGLSATGCARKKPPPPITHMAFVAGPPGLGDRAFNDAAKAGLDACHEETGINVEIDTAPTTGDIEPKIVLAATKKIDTVVAIGYPAAPAVNAVARRFEDVHFALIDAVAAQPNVQSIRFAEEQGAFLAGSLAALVSKTHRIAFIGGADVPLLERSEAGFIAGARAADPHVTVSAHYLTSFEDPAPAQTLAQTLIATKNDILFIVAGPAGSGAFKAVAANPGTFAIGSDVDQRDLAPGKVLASVVKRIDVAALHVCRETVAVKPAGGTLVLGLAEDGIGLTDLSTGTVPVDAAVAARIGRIRTALIAHRITAPASRAELARFTPVAIP